MKITMKERDVLGGVETLDKGEALNFTLSETAQLANVSAEVLRREVKLGRIRSKAVNQKTSPLKSRLLQTRWMFSPTLHLAKTRQSTALFLNLPISASAFVSGCHSRARIRQFLT
jgi:hypothetical protein